MTDIKTRLLAVDHMNVEDCFLQSPLFAEAAATISSLEARITELEEALKPFAEASVWRGDHVEVMDLPRPPSPNDFDLMEFAGNSLTLCDLLDARDAFAGRSALTTGSQQ